MDLIRSAYRTKMRFYPDRPDIQTPVRWYFTLPGAKPFPGFTVFGSFNWMESKNAWPLLGEVIGAPRPWSNGQAPGGQTGTSFVGTLDNFVNGVPYPFPFLLPRLLNGVPVSLKPQPGGVFLTGSAGMSKVATRTLLPSGGFVCGGGRIRPSYLTATGALTVHSPDQ